MGHLNPPLNPLPMSSISDLMLVFGVGYKMGAGDYADYFDDIEDLIFSDETSQTISTTLPESSFTSFGFNSSNKGYTLGGRNSTTALDDINDFIFSSQVLTTLSATLPTVLYWGASINSWNCGYTLGGMVSATDRVKSIEKFPFGVESATTISTQLDVFDKAAWPGASCTTKGYAFGGLSGDGVGTRRQTIERFIYADETSVQITDDLRGSTRNAAAMNSETHGYCMGGNTGLAIDDIDSLNFSTDTISYISAKISGNREDGAGVNSSERGFHMGGHNAGTGSSVIDGFDFSDDTRDTISATLDQAYGGICGIQYGFL